VVKSLPVHGSFIILEYMFFDGQLEEGEVVLDQHSCVLQRDILAKHPGAIPGRNDKRREHREAEQQYRQKEQIYGNRFILNIFLCVQVLFLL
jgi:hypothetical protein